MLLYKKCMVICQQKCLPLAVMNSEGVLLTGKAVSRSLWFVSTWWSLWVWQRLSVFYIWGHKRVTFWLPVRSELASPLVHWGTDPSREMRHVVCAVVRLFSGIMWHLRLRCTPSTVEMLLIYLKDRHERHGSEARAAVNLFDILINRLGHGIGRHWTDWWTTKRSLTICCLSTDTSKNSFLYSGI